MPEFESFFEWLEATTLARSIAESLLITAWLSAIHLIGFTLVMSGALISNLRLLGVLLPQRTVVEISRPANRVIVLGLAVSVVTGVLLFSGRAATAIANGTFQLKMLLLLAAVTFHFTVHARVARRAGAGTRGVQATAALGLLLWLGLALTACAFILFE